MRTASRAVLVAILALGLVGCGGSSGGDPSGPGVEGHASSTPVPEHLKVKLLTATSGGIWYFDEVRIIDTAP